MAAKSFVRRVASGEAGLWPGSGPTLARLDIELTERCNNDCIHCAVNRPAGDAAAREREWPARRWQELLTEAAGLGCLVVRLTGGEPLLRSDFEDIYLHARRLGLRVMLFTNATLLGPRLARLLRDVPPLEAVEVSVYGLTKESAEAVTRTPGSHEACLRGLRLLGENGVPFAVKGAVLPPTRHEVEAFEAWAAGLPGSVGPPSFAVLFDLRSRPDAAQSARIAGLRPDGQAFVRFAAGRDGRAAEEWREFCGRSGRGGGDRLFTCRPGAGASAAVDPYGRLQYCLGLRHPETVYDLASGSLRQAVTEFLPRLRDRRTTNPAYLERCGRCFLKDLCGQCPAKSWAEHGRLDTPVEYLCGIAHAQAVAAGLLGKGEKAWTVPNGPERAQRRNDP